jgi:hypothetical protein
MQHTFTPANFDQSTKDALEFCTKRLLVLATKESSNQPLTDAEHAQLVALNQLIVIEGSTYQDPALLPMLQEAVLNIAEAIKQSDELEAAQNITAIAGPEVTTNQAFVSRASFLQNLQHGFTSIFEYITSNLVTHRYAPVSITNEDELGGEATHSGYAQVATNDANEQQQEEIEPSETTNLMAPRVSRSTNFVSELRRRLPSISNLNIPRD